MLLKNGKKTTIWYWKTNNSIKNLDVSNLIKLKYLYTQGNLLTYLNVEGCINIESILCNGNNLTEIPTLISIGSIVDYEFTHNNFPTLELNRFRAMGFTDESRLLPQNT